MSSNWRPFVAHAPDSLFNLDSPQNSMRDCENSPLDLGYL